MYKAVVIEFIYYFEKTFHFHVLKNIMTVITSYPIWNTKLAILYEMTEEYVEGRSKTVST